MTLSRLRVLVADGSTVDSLFLAHLLGADPGFHVVGAVTDGRAALRHIERCDGGATEAPDVILMDLHLPGLDGFAATRAIMETRAIPIVICSATDDVRDTQFAFRALAAGAIACVEKPHFRGDPAFDQKVAHMLQTVRLMAEVKVVRRHSRPGALPVDRASLAPVSSRSRAGITVVGIGASTGGPPALQAIFSRLPADFGAPLLVVQHIAPSFLPGLVGWLADSCNLPVHIASYGALPLPGHVYLAPDGAHLGLGRDGRLVLSRESAEYQVRPAVSFLFRSLTASRGPAAAGVLLTGMGRDGAQELKAMRDSGAPTIAQDRHSSVVHGMPGVAIALGGAGQILPVDRIAGALAALVCGPDPNQRR